MEDPAARPFDPAPIDRNTGTKTVPVMRGRFYLIPYSP